MTEDEIRLAQKDGPWLLVAEDGSIRSIQPGRTDKVGKIVQVLHLGRALSLTDCKRIIGMADQWARMPEDDRTALLLSDPHQHGALAQAAARVKKVTNG